MIAKQALIEAADRAASDPSRPLSAQCARAIGAQLEREDPPWWKEAQTAWKDRYFPSADQALLLVIAALHHEGVRGRSLAAVLPTCGGDAAGLPKAVAAFLESPTPGFAASLSRRFVNYSSYWASRWLEPAELFFQRRGARYRLVEFNSAGGLGAFADRITPKDGFDSSLIESRAGLSEAPLDLRRDADAQWLLACNPMDDAAVADAARAARRLREELALRPETRGWACAAAADATEDPRRFAPPVEGSGLLVFSLGWLSQSAPARRAAASAALMELLAAWGGRALWIEVDRRDHGSPALETRAYRLSEGRVARQVLSTLEASQSGLRASFADDAAGFLA